CSERSRSKTTEEACTTAAMLGEFELMAGMSPFPVCINNGRLCIYFDILPHQDGPRNCAGFRLPVFFGVRMSVPGTVNSVDHALRLIALLAESGPQPATVSDLARALDLPRPTLYRLLATLGQHQFVARDGKGWRLTL